MTRQKNRLSHSNQQTGSVDNMETISSCKQKINIILIDSSASFRAAFRSAMPESSGITVAAEASCAAEARKKLLNADIRPAAALIELSADNIAFACELSEKYSVQCIFMQCADGISQCDPFPADTVKKPCGSTEMASFCSLLSAKIILSAARTAGRNVPAPEKNGKIQTTEALRPSADDLARLEERSKSGFVVAMGASTGGTDALERVIKTFPETMPPILVVQHMPPGFTRLYSERLDRCCAVRVKEACDGDRLSKGLCLVAAGGAHMELKKDPKGYFVKCTQGEKVSGHCPSVDTLFFSVAETAGNKAAGVIMTGMGCDGAKGLLKMRRSGAYTIGQDKNSCAVYGMPMEAYKLGACSEQLPLEKIGAALCRKMTDGWTD